MTSSGVHLLPQATKALEAGWVKIAEDGFRGDICRWMRRPTCETGVCSSSFEAAVI